VQLFFSKSPLRMRFIPQPPPAKLDAGEWIGCGAPGALGAIERPTGGASCGAALLRAAPRLATSSEQGRIQRGFTVALLSTLPGPEVEACSLPDRRARRDVTRLDDFSPGAGPHPAGAPGALEARPLSTGRPPSMSRRRELP